MTDEPTGLDDPVGADDPAGADASAPVAARRRSRGSFAYLVGLVGTAAVVLLADQLSKVWAEGALVVGEPARPLVGDLVGLRLIYNSGAALSIGSGMTWVLTLLSAAVVVFIVVSARRIRSTAWALALGLVLGGALGNLGDRLFRAPGFPEGHVVDFIDYGPFIGNVADIAIVLAAVLIAVLALVGIGTDGERAVSAKADAPRDARTADTTSHDTSHDTTGHDTTGRDATTKDTPTQDEPTRDEPVS